MSELEQHHIRYLEIHGEDEIIMLSHDEHVKVHVQDRANGAESIPLWIVEAAHLRSPAYKAAWAAYEKSKESKARYARYRRSENGEATRVAYMESEKGRAKTARYTQSGKSKAASARWRAKQKEMKSK